MKRRLLPGFLIAAILSAGVVSCSKDDTPPANNNDQDIQKVETAVLNDFVNKLANPLYKDFAVRAGELNDKVQQLAANPSEAAQTDAQEAWKAVRVLWEQSEGFLIGPVDDNEYDPHLDSWPTDHNEIENILTERPTITAEDLKNVDDFVRGFHPLEYLLWDKSPAEYTEAEKHYMTALSEYILANVTELQESWLNDGYGKTLANPGPDNEVFETKSEALQLIAEALVTICDEVGNSKMTEPFNDSPNAPDSTISESPYSHNSVNDFRNNIVGAYQSYTCTYNGNSGTSLSTLVQINNKQLDQQIKAAFQNAINSFEGFTNTFEYSIYKDQSTVQNVIDQIQTLNDLLQTELVAYIQRYVKD